MSKSTDLVVAEDPTALSIGKGLPDQCRQFLTLFIEKRYIYKAAYEMRQSRDLHQKWIRQVPGFADAWELALQDVRDQEFDRLGMDNELGAKETMYNAEGELQYTRYRQSDQLRKMRLIALDPDRYADQARQGTNITINIVQSKEGGW